MEHALSSVHDSAYSTLFIQFPRTKILAIFRYRAIMRLVQTVLYAYGTVNIYVCVYVIQDVINPKSSDFYVSLV